MSTTGSGRPRGKHVRRVRIEGRQVWVLEDGLGIVEMTECRETLQANHPEVRLDRVK